MWDEDSQTPQFSHSTLLFYDVETIRSHIIIFRTFAMTSAEIKVDYEMELENFV